MQGTIYLNKNSNNQDDGFSREAELEDVVSPLPEQSGVAKEAGDKEEEIHKEESDYVYPDEILTKETDAPVWKPGFLQPEEDLKQEAEEIAQVLPISHDERSPEDLEKNVKNVRDLKNGENETSGNGLQVLDSDPYLENISPSFLKYLMRFKNAAIEENRKAPNPIYVDEIASRVARVYESVRRIIDWKEEHLMRRAVIERVLKRKFVSKVYGISIVPDVKPADAAEPFVMELIRSGYFPNGKIAKEKILEVQKILEKYLYVLSNVFNGNGNSITGSKKELKSYIKKKINFYNWIIEIAACEIENALDPSLREEALLDLMTECLIERLKVLPENELSEDTVYLQSYIAVHKTLFNLDDSIISFNILRHKYNDFFTNPDSTPYFTENALSIWEEINSDLEYKKGSEFFRVADKCDAAYLMIGDSMNKLDKDISAINQKVSDQSLFLESIEKSYNERLATLKKRLSKLAIFSTLSIFVAGAASLLIFEIPIAKWVRGYFSPWAIVADLAIPTALMFLLVWMIKPPSKNNLDAVKEEVIKVVYKNEQLDVYEVRLKKKVRKLLNFIFALVYVSGGLASLYGIFWVFELANVPWTSLYINTANVAMVVASAMAIRQRSKEITIVEKANIIEFLLDFFSIPLAKIGAWFSAKWKEYNIVSVFFVALIDFPFSSFVATIEGWRNFIKDKRSEIQ